MRTYLFAMVFVVVCAIIAIPAIERMSDAVQGGGGGQTPTDGLDRSPVPRLFR
jgi:hypothetical protein